MIYCVILAGGSGTRFWPLSRQLHPKQFLNICSERPLIDLAINRVHPLVKKEDLFIAANRTHGSKVRSCLKGLSIPGKNLFFEPASRNTLAPIAYFSYLFSRAIYL